jgi:fatty aldehyde-generating acyl-ACP reductase
MPLPFLTNRAPWFTFLGHFRDERDMYRTGGGHFLRRYSLDEDDFERKMCTLPPLVVGEFTFGMDSAIRGELIIVMRRAESMLKPSAARAVLEGVKVAVDRGSKVIGLGALTSPAMGGGTRVLKHVPSGVTITNGNALTAAMVRRNTMDVVEALELDRAARVAVVGCTGSVGVAASVLLAERGLDLILVGRTERKVRDRLPGLVQHHRCTDRLDAVVAADVVVLLTSDPTAELQPEHVRAGAVVLDFAEPANVRPGAEGRFEVRGAPVLKGGRVGIPRYACSFDWGLGDPRDTLACLAETFLFAREGIREHSVGLPSPGFAEEMEHLAERWGIRPRPLELERIRRTAGSPATSEAAS